MDKENYVNEAFYGSLYIRRHSFRHEKELRALTFRVNAGHGVDIPVDLEILIERLVLSPELKHWAVRFITEAIRHCGFGGCIEKSALTPAEDLYIVDVDALHNDLYRMGNSGSPNFSEARSLKDCATIAQNGIGIVIANGNGFRRSTSLRRT